MSDSFTSSSDINDQASFMSADRLRADDSGSESKQVCVQCVSVSTLSLTWVGHPAFGDKLGEQDAKGPDVRLDGEATVQCGLWRRPFDGEFGSYVHVGEERGEVFPLVSVLLHSFFFLNPQANNNNKTIPS